MNDIDRKIVLALFLALVIGGVLLVHFFREPTRMAAASEEFRLEAVTQGEEPYAEHCAMCHGAEG